MAGIELDRKILADLAVKDPAGFASLATQAKGAIGGAAYSDSAVSLGRQRRSASSSTLSCDSVPRLSYNSAERSEESVLLAAGELA